MGYHQIGDHGIVGDSRTVALVARDGAVDWMCLPYLDSPSVFAALLDDERGGHFAVRPAQAFDSVQEYLDGTNVLATRFRTPAGQLELIDFMPMEGPSRLVRRAHAPTGTIDVELECRLRFDYARKVPVWRRLSDRAFALQADGHAVVLAASRPVDWDAERARCTLGAGQTLWLVLAQGQDEPACEASRLEQALAATSGYWRSWLRAGPIGRYPVGGFWESELRRSALVLKLLQMRDSGALAAAATTSLPAIVYAERNWDYRFAWIRDASMTVATLFELGHDAEASAYLTWLQQICARDPSGRLDIVYRLREPAPPTSETPLAHLSGYKGSAPVRIGQFVVHQRQHDIYGELLDTLFIVSRRTGKITFEHWCAFRPLVDQVIRIWREPDDGIWEARIGAQHYTHSKLMCWVALDRAIKIAEHYGFPGDIQGWQRSREEIRADILAHGYDAVRNTFVQHYATHEVDAALLLIPLSGFLPVDDPRVAGTIRAIEGDLLRDGVLLRYVAPDGLPGQEMGFMICLFWYLECLILQRRLDEVEEYLRAIGGCANPLGLFGEQFDPRWREITGNFPQAYSHIGYVSVLLKYLDARHATRPPQPIGWSRKLVLLFRRELLNPTIDSKQESRGGDPAQQVKRAMDVLRSHFYDGHLQRVHYSLIRGSEYYQTLRSAAARLADFDLNALLSDAERTAFWVNVYNAIVIHGVIDLGIDSSVREVPRFFDRICYRIGGCDYTPDDIEHGILRGNVRPPWGLRRQMRTGDPRLAHRVRRPDPRIHFALVCASKTCPPIEVYDAERLEQQLQTSAAVFLNGTTRFDPARGRLSVSEVFRWYRADFPREDAALVRYIARYLYDAQVRAAIEAAAPSVRIEFAPYDWRLNR